jgi:hypothetical protein
MSRGDCLLRSSIALLPAAVHELLLELRKSRDSGVERWVSRVQGCKPTLTN